MTPIKKVIDDDTSYRPILIIANSSWYIYHYRELLIDSLKRNGEQVIALSPSDSYSKDLSKRVLHIPLRIKRANNLNFLGLIIAFIKMFLIVRALKPKIIHSHTLQANLIASVTSYFLQIPCVLSFTGMGQLSKDNKFKKLLLNMTLEIISFCYNNRSLIKFTNKTSSIKGAFIFQNPKDIKQYGGKLAGNKSYNKLILGSGVPKKYDCELNGFKNGWIDKETRLNISNERIKLNIIYCARLLKSKGIFKFINLSSNLSSHSFHAFGKIDEYNKDSLTTDELIQIKKTSKNIKFMGNIKDPLLTMDFNYPILLIPSNYGEGLPRAIAEALAGKIPVICSKNATCDVFKKDIVFVAEDDSINSYLKCIDQIMLDHKSDLLRRRIELGYKFYIENLCEELIVKNTLNIYKNLEQDKVIQYNL